METTLSLFEQDDGSNLVLCLLTGYEIVVMGESEGKHI